ncbi:MAG: hypothetical protein ACRC6M_19385 [Microcystaceae cyanobacterium]
MRSLTNIRERLINLESKTTEAFTEICDVYKTYLNQLEQAVNQQLIFAVHHIATQIYPEIFLTLSFSDRARFQRKLRQSIQEFSPKLTHFLASQGVRLETKSSLLSDDADGEPTSLSEEEDNSQNFLEVRTPEHLTHWCRSVEESVSRLLDYLSQEANKLLQSVEIINNKLPPQLLEMALQAEESGMNIGRSGSPNILNLVIEARQERSPVDDSSEAEENEDQEDDDDDDDERSSNSQILKITAIHLRLTEIEFSDPSLSVARKQLRYLGEQISKLRKQYKALQREYVKSEAELAWKASWVED